MKHLILALCLMLSVMAFGRGPKHDTIDVYWVYYNDSVIAKLNQNMSGTVLHIKAAQIKKGNKITVRYTTDTHCPDCEETLVVKGSNGKNVFYADATGSWAPMVVKLEEMFVPSFKSYQFYYNEKTLLFTLVIDN